MRGDSDGALAQRRARPTAGVTEARGPQRGWRIRPASGVKDSPALCKSRPDARAVLFSALPGPLPRENLRMQLLSPKPLQDQNAINDAQGFSTEVRIDNFATGDAFRWLGGLYVLEDEEYRHEKNIGNPAHPDNLGFYECAGRSPPAPARRAWSTSVGRLKLDCNLSTITMREQGRAD